MALKSGPHSGRAGTSYDSGASNAEDVAWPQDTSRPYCCRELGKVLMVREPSNDATEIATVVANHGNAPSFGKTTEMHIRQGTAQKCRRDQSSLAGWPAYIASPILGLQKSFHNNGDPENIYINDSLTRGRVKGERFGRPYLVPRQEAYLALVASKLHCNRKSHLAGKRHQGEENTSKKRIS